jgi:hypothetical protein
MLEAINLMRFSKYGFLASVSAFLAFIASENPNIRMPLIYLWIGSVFIAIIAILWRTVEQTDEGTIYNHLLTMFQKLEAVIIVSLITFGVMMGLLR